MSDREGSASSSASSSTSSRTSRETARKRVRSLRGLAAIGSVALIASLLLLLMANLTTGTAHGSGTGGGSCFATTGPVCTFHSHEADADFGNVDFTACVGTDTTIQAFESLSNPGQTAGQQVFVSIVTFNPCTGALIGGASNLDPNSGQPIFTGSTQFGSKLSTATVSGTAPMFDLFTGTQVFTTTIQLTWQGIGPSSTFIDNSHQRGAGFALNSHFHGVSRGAMASGELTDAGGTNLAATPTTAADLSNATSGTVQLIHI